MGEGNNELGWFDRDGARDRGVLEALLVKVCATGWECAGKLPWGSIQKFQAGGAHLMRSSHGDYLNVLGLVLAGLDQAADAVAFTRDVDGEPERQAAVEAALTWIERESGWTIRVIGGVARPAVEGWVLALRGVPGTDEMSRARTRNGLEEHGIAVKYTHEYVEVVDRAELGPPPSFGLPSGADSLRAWLTVAHDVLDQLVHGTLPP